MKIEITTKLKKTKEMEYLDWTGVNGGGPGGGLDWHEWWSRGSQLKWREKDDDGDGDGLLDCSAAQSSSVEGERKKLGT